MNTLQTQAPEGWTEITLTAKTPGKDEQRWRFKIPTHVVRAILRSADKALQYAGITRANFLVFDYGGDTIGNETLTGREVIFDVFDIIAAKISDREFEDYTLRVAAITDE